MAHVNRVTTVTGEWECTECGYVEEGNELRRPTHCPECNAPADAFEFFSYEEELEEDDDWDDRAEPEYDEDEDLDEGDDLYDD